jgi:broad specificity phosphatase PhoE
MLEPNRPLDHEARSSPRDDDSVTRLVLMRHAQPFVADGTPAHQWPLTDEGRRDAAALGRRLADGSTSTIVFTSPERKARETASLAFPSITAHVREQLSEVKRPWYAKSDEFAEAVAHYLSGEVIEGWERREDVIDRLGWLKADATSSERMVIVSHGVLLTTWLNHERGLEDPFRFWSNLRVPDAWEIGPEETSLERVASHCRRHGMRVERRRRLGHGFRARP